jgi:hypothetical protein
LDVEYTEERRADGKRVRYRVSPTMCVLNWTGIITIQELKKGAEIGIQSAEIAK